MKLTRDDLYFVEDWKHNTVRKVSGADLAAMGLVQAPECGECQWPCPRDTDGDGNCGQRFCPICGAGVCPKCGGSGYGRLVSLDVDVEALREAATLSVHDLAALDWRKVEVMHDFTLAVLAALDGEAT